VLMTSNTRGFAIGDNGIIVHTYDGGLTWDVVRELDIALQTEKWIDIAYNSNHSSTKLAIISESGQLLLMDPANVNSHTLHTPSTNPTIKQTAIDQFDQDFIISLYDETASTSSIILWSSSSSTALDDVGLNDWIYVATTNSGLVYAVSDDGRLFKSVPSTQSWNYIESNLNAPIRQM